MPPAHPPTQTGASPATGAAPAGIELPPRYAYVAPLGAGAMGEVHRVVDRQLGCELAMKVMRWDAAHDPLLRERFVAEARTTAQLRHPGVVSVQDLGELPDGRLWFTMDEVRGTTLADAVRAFHDGRWGSLRQLVNAVERVGWVTAYAHARDVVHRDLKPSNVMLGSFDEVVVMDWGLAVRADEPAPRAGGTPQYASPEQARGRPAGPASDVYALGALLYEVLGGLPPYDGAALPWKALLAGPPAPLPASTPRGGSIPDGLRAVVEAAMDREPEGRPSAAAFAEDVRRWIDGEHGRERAAELVAGARGMASEAAALRERSRHLAERARTLLGSLPPHAPVEDKLAGWEAEDERTALLQRARLLDVTFARDLRAALAHAPELREAHELLADHHRARAEEGMRSRDTAAVAEHLLLLETHDRGRHRAWRRGDGTLELVTDPPDATAWIHRYRVRGRRALAEPEGTAIAPVRRPVPHGELLVVLQAPGRLDTRLPLVVERAGSPRPPPGERACPPTWLPPVGALRPEEVHVPAGWFRAGGDPEALDALTARDVWVDGFCIDRLPVTHRAFLAFLDALSAEGREEEAWRWVPRDGPGHVDPTRPIHEPTPAGWRIRPDRAAGMTPDHPVTLVDWFGADAYARWLGERTGLPLRLPHDLEWEKAARGVAGWCFPWGDHLEPSWVCMQHSHRGVPTPAPVDSYPVDTSVFGVRGLGGNVRDWCGNGYVRSGDVADGERLAWPREEGDAPEYRVVRGGAWSSSAAFCRSASRFAGRPADRLSALGFRLARSLGARGA